MKNIPIFICLYLPLLLFSGCQLGVSYNPNSVWNSQPVLINPYQTNQVDSPVISLETAQNTALNTIMSFSVLCRTVKFARIGW
ncbi:MAG: hypothetical protein ABSG94_12600 [Brevinematales bacterium]